MKKKKRPDNSSSPRGGYRENAGRKSGWNHKDTCTIRVPKEFASQLVEIARRLDKGEKIDNDTESIHREKDLVTKSKLVSSLGDRKFIHQSGLQFDIDTNSKSLVDDTVTESTSSSGESLSQLQKQQDLSAELENDTESKPANFDIVNKYYHFLYPGRSLNLKLYKQLASY